MIRANRFARIALRIARATKITYALVFFKAQLGEPFLENLIFLHLFHLFFGKTGT